MSDYPISPVTRFWTSEAPLALELGGELPAYTLAFRTWGELSAQGDNAVIVCHALTGSADAETWWADLFGAGKAIDPTQDFVICSNTLGSCYGSTGPTSSDPSGRRWGARFPRLTIRDQVRAQMALADALGVRRIKLVIGGSMGGLQTLEWALSDATRVESIVVVAASASHSAWCVTWSETQRMAIRCDPKFRDGDYPQHDAPHDGLGVARAIAMATYRSAGALERRYGRNNGAQVFGSQAKAPEQFAVQNWVSHHADSFVRRFDANSYIALINAMDQHDVGRGRGGIEAALGSITQPALVVSISSDALYVPAEQEYLFDMLPNARLVEVASPHGHDGFLIDAVHMESSIREFRGTPMAGQHHAILNNVAEVATYAE
ncbi:homoserine O-acetyltransferase MetX [Lysobacter tyrosinilyticus]